MVWSYILVNQQTQPATHNVGDHIHAFLPAGVGGENAVFQLNSVHSVCLLAASILAQICLFSRYREGQWLLHPGEFNSTGRISASFVIVHNSTVIFSACIQLSLQ